MNCPKCNSPLEEIAFKLQYGKHYETAYICTGGCPGLWTETSIGLYQEMMQRRRRKPRRFLEDKPKEAYELSTEQ